MRVLLGVGGGISSHHYGRFSGGGFMTPKELYNKYPLPGIEREAAVVNEVLKGNTPPLTFIKVQNALVANDYLAFGTKDDFCRCPLTPYAAQFLANKLGYQLPTSQLVNFIWKAAAVKLEPVTMNWNYVPPITGHLGKRFIDHNTLIKRAWGEKLIAGHKKDVVSNIAKMKARPHHVVIYGWHSLHGNPIQPETSVHDWAYADYSHGIRFVKSDDKTMAGPCSLDSPPVDFVKLIK